MQNRFARTDLAHEAAARLDALPEGVACDHLTLHGCRVERVVISTEDGAAAVGKDMGKYLTLALEDYVMRRQPDFAACARAVSDILRSFAAVEHAKSFLIACLGNRAVTPDAIGPCTADSLIITRHMKSSLPEQFADFSSVAAVCPGVLGTTGIESVQTVRAACGITEPDCLIVVDALAGSDAGRLCRSIQLCDSGIAPGSGVGNDRAALNRNSVGCPVIAIGVPTVIDASALCSGDELKGLFVTPKNIDELVRSASRLIAYGINLALHRGLEISDIDSLVE